MNSLPRTVTQQCCGCDLNPGPTAPESSMLTIRLLGHPLTKFGINMENSKTVTVTYAN